MSVSGLNLRWLDRKCVKRLQKVMIDSLKLVTKNHIQSNFECDFLLLEEICDLFMIRSFSKVITDKLHN